MIDARIIVDELVVECLAPCSETEAHRLGGSVTQELSSQLKDLQARRLHAANHGAPQPRPIHIARMIVRLGHNDYPPSTVARTLRDAVDEARRPDDQSL